MNFDSANISMLLGLCLTGGQQIATGAQSLYLNSGITLIDAIWQKIVVKSIPYFKVRSRLIEGGFIQPIDIHEKNIESMPPAIKVGVAACWRISLSDECLSCWWVRHMGSRGFSKKPLD